MALLHWGGHRPADRVAAGGMRCLWSPSGLKAVTFFTGGFSQGPLGVTQKLKGESGSSLPWKTDVLLVETVSFPWVAWESILENPHFVVSI